MGVCSHLGVGARPNFIKVGPLHRALKRHGGFVSRIVHTGRLYYDERMSVPSSASSSWPSRTQHLRVRSDTHVRQTARVRIAFQKLVAERPTRQSSGRYELHAGVRAVAAKHDVRLAHVEAGLRSFHRRMPTPRGHLT